MKIDEIFVDFVSNRISIEDKNDAVSALEWRDIPRSLKLTESQLKKHINSWLSGTVVLSSIVLLIGFAVVFFLIIAIVNPKLVGFDNNTGLMLGGFVDFVPVVKTSVLLALIQMFAFWATLIDRSKESEFIRNVWGKVVDWIVVITLYRALYCVEAEFWSVKLNTPFPKMKNIKIPEYKVIVHNKKSEEQMMAICQKIKELNPISKAIRFEIFYNDKRKELELETAFPDWTYSQPLINIDPILNEIPQEDVQAWEQHLLGRNKFLANEEIPDSWFGDGEKAVWLGKKIWENDVNHRLVMHPKITVSDVGVFVFVHLFRKLESSTEYRNFAETILSLAYHQFSDKTLIDIWIFYRMDDSKKIAELSWFNTLANKYSYKDEYLKRTRVYPSKLN